MRPRHTEKQFEVAADWFVKDWGVIHKSDNNSAFFDRNCQSLVLSLEEKLLRKEYEEKCLAGFKQDIITYFKSCSPFQEHIFISCHYLDSDLMRMCRKNNMALPRMGDGFFAVTITSDGKVYSTIGIQNYKTEWLYDENYSVNAISNSK